MKIQKVDTVGSSAPVSGKKGVSRTEAPASVEGVSGGDVVSVSPRVAELGRLLQAGEAEPDVRTEEVAAIQAQIRDGNYKVDPEQVADAMIDSHITNRGT